MLSIHKLISLEFNKLLDAYRSLLDEPWDETNRAWEVYCCSVAYILDEYLDEEVLTEYEE